MQQLMLMLMRATMFPVFFKFDIVVAKVLLAVNPRLDGKTKQLLIRSSMDKFQCNHQMLELCKRSMRRKFHIISKRISI